MSLKTMNDIKRNFESREIMAERLAEAVADRLRQSIGSRGRACLSVGGGRFPKPFFRALSVKPLSWEKVTVVLGDERWVEPTDEASNEKLVRENLLVGEAASAQFIGLKTDHAEPEKGLYQIEKRLADLPELIDVTVLGMGEDGHTASLFPSAKPDELSQALNPPIMRMQLSCTRRFRTLRELP